MVVKVCENAPTCHRAQCSNAARLAYRGDRFPLYCSKECRREDVRANRGTPWAEAWERSRGMLAAVGRIVPDPMPVRLAV
ncbi:hypothetical protein [Thermomonospora amylolytica]|uniref:hypothetical protein n=1 Tax=Thermomonospora amylolytica TaxID=1411117 RepID=UPI00130029C2|nr:hypothetical protein [Thermomonospora amylolytica]